MVWVIYTPVQVYGGIGMKALSMDLRTRIIAAVEDGKENMVSVHDSQGRIGVAALGRFS